MMIHYLETKKQYDGCILFYRLGDFYEMFFSDAKTVSRELELTLTSKSGGMEERAPMCGVPFHAAENYITRLVKLGYKVAVCEQVEDPKEAKGIVKREVIRIVTPGTNLSTEALEEGKNNYLLSVFYSEDKYGLTFSDISTGDTYVTETETEEGFYDEMAVFIPSEILCSESFLMSPIDISLLKEKYNIALTPLDSHYFDGSNVVDILLERFRTKSLEGLGLKDFPAGTVSLYACFKYLSEVQKTDLSQMNSLRTYRSGNYMMLDSSTRRNLELTETMRDKEKRGSLLWVLDKTKTAMGQRLLRSVIEQPLKDKKMIEARLDAVTELKENMVDRAELREYLNLVYDLERLSTRIVLRTANPRDLLAFKQSISVLPEIKKLISGFSSKLLKEIHKEIDTLSDIYELIDNSISEEAPITIHDGGILKMGYNKEIDELRLAKTDGKDWVLKLEEEEKEKTGIKNLRIKNNRVFGYYIEVTNSYKELVPETYIRKQTLANAERFYTPELKELENKILGAEEKLGKMESEIFRGILDKISDEVLRIQKTAKKTALLDVLQSLSEVAEKQRFQRPKINDKGVIEIKKGRHPVVELMLKHDGFIENDTYLDKEDHRFSIITGPNMAGKSTYMRQTALITLMAQIGSFVPAQEANIGICDRIFTRVGASDDLSSGQSTFMVEMNEVSNILRNATADSLIILDEIGRGTSTFDGLSIAWAVVECISDKEKIGAKTLFATHYHELTELQGKLSGVENFRIAVRENGDDIVFLRKIVPGGADKSYGIQVARLAGLPDGVIKRSKEILEKLVNNDLTENAKNLANESAQTDEYENYGQLSFNFTVPQDTDPSEREAIKELKEIDVSNMTPLEALNKLYELQKKVR
ncbi:MAG: DNA mismatch repair protein MutS [Lachnospiraceae bacterium]|nr:DNA mismatch repair protein MutS [Lachnospiraceae bacterium]